MKLHITLAGSVPDVVVLYRRDPRPWMGLQQFDGGKFDLRPIRKVCFQFEMPARFLLADDQRRCGLSKKKIARAIIPMIFAEMLSAILVTKHFQACKLYFHPESLNAY